MSDPKSTADEASASALPQAHTPAAGGDGSTPGAATETGTGAPAAPAAPDPAQPGRADPEPTAGDPRRGPARSDGMLVLGAPAPEQPAPPPDSPEPDCPPCLDCGGTLGADGYCEQCGARRPNPRHRYERQAPRDTATAWVAGVCDRGIRHATNEDALALDAGAPAGDRRAAMVVCDGVSTARRSARASQQAADAALAVLTASHSRGLAGVASAHVGALAGRLDAATDAAAQAVFDVAEGPEAPEDVEETGIPHISDPACTFVAAIVDDDVAVVGSVGDSRAYWVPDEGQVLLLTTDDSWAEEQIALGMPRSQAETAPQAHTITRWLGLDAPDHTPRKTTLRLEAPGWLLLCSDGLWNYASEPRAIAGVFADITVGRPQSMEPLSLARRLVEWANAQGGRDNITVALARVEGPAADAAASAETMPLPTATDASDPSDPSESVQSAQSPQSGGATRTSIETEEKDS